MATEAQWRQLVRRAVGVPDLIGDEVALAMVTDVVFSSEPQSQPRSDDDDVIAEAVWGPPLSSWVPPRNSTPS